jgi:hypothetical protein
MLKRLRSIPKMNGMTVNAQKTSPALSVILTATPTKTDAVPAAVIPVIGTTMSDLQDFIREVEDSHFRTVSDYGGNPNALFIWNRVREFAGLDPLSYQDLVDKAPEVAELKALKQEYNMESGQFLIYSFPSFGDWLSAKGY